MTATYAHAPGTARVPRVEDFALLFGLESAVRGVLLSAVLWRALVKMHARLQAALRDTLERPSPDD